MEEPTLGKYYDQAPATDIHQTFWDVANIHDRKDMNALVKHHLGLAQRNLHQAWKLQTHMNELGEFDKGE
jgi:hypothetical protein